MNYSQKELNEIILTKQLNEFYFAILENREISLSTEEYEKIKNSDVVYDDNAKEAMGIFSEVISKSPKAKESGDSLMQTIYSLVLIRQVAILTVIGDEVYDVANSQFINFKRRKIVHYDNFTNYYDETNARVKIFTPEEQPLLTEDTALIDVDETVGYQKYENDHIEQEETEDLTAKFLAEAKDKNIIFFPRPKKR